MAKSGSTTIVRVLANSLLDAQTEDAFNREDVALRDYAKSCGRQLRRDLIAFSESVRRFYGFRRVRMAV
jgi:hypothetical protein